VKGGVGRACRSAYFGVSAFGVSAFGVSAYRRIGVSAYRRIGVSAAWGSVWRLWGEIHIFRIASKRGILS
jgi:hypothetical protein